jgi:aquaporin Z
MAKGSGVQSVHLELFAAEALPGQGYSLEEVLLGEVITTFGLVAGLCVFLGFRKLRPFTPWVFPFPYALMVYAEAPISGTSTNPVRSLGPSIVSGQWQGWWIYWIGPLIGTFLALIVCTALAVRCEGC